MRSDIILCCADLSFSRMLVLELEELHLSVRHYTMLPDRLPDLIKKNITADCRYRLTGCTLKQCITACGRVCSPRYFVRPGIVPAGKTALNHPYAKQRKGHTAFFTPAFPNRGILILHRKDTCRLLSATASFHGRACTICNAGCAS